MGKILVMNKEMTQSVIDKHIRDGIECGLLQFSDVEGNSPSYEELLNNEGLKQVLVTVHAVMSGWIAAKGVDSSKVVLSTDNLLRISKGESLH